MKFLSLKYSPGKFWSRKCFLLPVPVSLSCLHGEVVGGSFEHCMGIRSTSGFKVGVPKVDVKGGWDCVLCIPDQLRIRPNYKSMSHGSDRFTDPFAA